MSTETAATAGWDAHVHVFDAAAPVRPGHYRPDDAPLARIEGLAERAGLGHLVLVQPSVYGTDNGLMVEALQMSPGRHRGVAVVDPAISDRELDRLHDAGVRAVRFNRVSPTGHREDPEPALRALTPRLSERGWHVQWYVAACDLTRVEAWQRATGLPFVLDHLAGLHAGLAPQDPAWDAVQRLAARGCWIKLSGWYRLQSTPPYRDLVPVVQWVAARFGARMVWGSDWPHTSFAPRDRPGYDDLMTPVRQALGDAAFQTVLRGAATLYAPSSPLRTDHETILPSPGA